MNLTDIITPQARLRVYRVIAWVGLALAAFGAGLGSLAAFNIVVPLGVLAGYAVAGAVYSTVAGAFGFVAKANVNAPDASTDILTNTHIATGNLTAEQVRAIVDSAGEVEVEPYEPEEGPEGEPLPSDRPAD